MCQRTHNINNFFMIRVFGDASIQHLAEWLVQVARYNISLVLDVAVLGVLDGGDVLGADLCWCCMRLTYIEIILHFLQFVKSLFT